MQRFYSKICISMTATNLELATVKALKEEEEEEKEEEEVMGIDRTEGT